MALEIGILMWVITDSGNVIGKLKEPAYAMEVLFFGFAAVILAALALWSAIPGRYLSTLEATIAGLLILADIADNCVRTDGYHTVSGQICAGRTRRLDAGGSSCCWQVVVLLPAPCRHGAAKGSAK